jgi:hypothetical protein
MTTFTCPHCGHEVEVPDELDHAFNWSIDTGDFWSDETARSVTAMAAAIAASSFAVSPPNYADAKVRGLINEIEAYNERFNA